ncbi:hypothetical protein WJ542_07345 [Paraburkholderia sp. B3]|uniref:hypothetical protein n=1 Tax=Paraburkholderia sp. B3 TaxID=3134791 RepID=UPI0039821DA1
MTTTPELYPLAMTFIAQHQAQHLEHDRHLLVERCIAHLIDAAGVSASTAEDAALQAVGEIESGCRREYIDLARATAYAVFVHDPVNGRKRVFTVADLMGLVRTPALASQPVPSTRTLSHHGMPMPELTSEHGQRTHTG